MAVDAFLKLIDRSGHAVPGESTAVGHQNEVEILSWSWGAQHPIAAAGAGAGRPQNVTLNLKKYLDRSSMPFFLQGVTGKGFQSAQLTLRKAGVKPVEFLVITMTDVFVTSLQDEGSGGDKPIESISLQFAKVEVKYVAQKPDGSPGDTINAGWDFAKNIQV